MKKIAQGAEAIIFEVKIKSPTLNQRASPVNHQNVNLIIKERFEKKYRIPELDYPLRQFRTRRESKILKKLEAANIPAPRLIESNDKTMTISMTKIDGIKLRDHLLTKKYTKSLGIKIGQHVGQLHLQNIIHQDLTTSNMIKTNKDITLIDFGLSFFSEKDEDKAVDLFLLERAIQSTHWTIHQKIWPDIITGYQIAHQHSTPQPLSSSTKLPNNSASSILKRLEQVKSRGRNKNK